tara:strand:+ start:6747 stop:7019 length:273 start_codon:yes stop_codon:yes gene_type:complete
MDEPRTVWTIGAGMVALFVTFTTFIRKLFMWKAGVEVRVSRLEKDTELATKAQNANTEFLARLDERTKSTHSDIKDTQADIKEIKTLLMK